jgi:signal transduction histidine kinase
MGLGLFISKSIVDAHQGKLKVTSKLGKGTTFAVCLPVSEEN